MQSVPAIVDGKTFLSVITAAEDENTAIRSREIFRMTDREPAVSWLQNIF